MKSSSLNRGHWLEAAFRALTMGGPSAIKAEAIARDLGVSKGSFYWHFQDVPALKSCMLSHWKEAATHAIIAELDKTTAPPQEKLRALVAIATSERDAAYGGAMVEAAIRDWARYDLLVAPSLKQVDTARLKYVEGLFQKHGFDKSKSKARAKTLYASLIGLQILSHHGLAKPNKELPALLEILLK